MTTNTRKTVSRTGRIVLAAFAIATLVPGLGTAVRAADGGIAGVQARGFAESDDSRYRPHIDDVEFRNDGRLTMFIHGSNFDSGAQVVVFAELMPSESINYVSPELIVVDCSLIQGDFVGQSEVLIRVVNHDSRAARFVYRLS